MNRVIVVAMYGLHRWDFSLLEGDNLKPEYVSGFIRWKIPIALNLLTFLVARTGYI